MEQQILAMMKEYPIYSYVKIADQLKLVGVPASASAVRGVWLRQGLLKKYNRLLWLERVLTDNGREYCGRPLHHPDELYLNGAADGAPEDEGPHVEDQRLLRALQPDAQEEFFSVAYRKTLYESVQQLQGDLDRWIVFYNEQGSHQGTAPRDGPRRRPLPTAWPWCQYRPTQRERLAQHHRSCPEIFS